MVTGGCRGMDGFADGRTQLPFMSEDRPVDVEADEV